MKYITLYNATPDMILAKPIYDSSNRVLVNEGKQLTETIIERLRKIGVHSLYVKSAETTGVTAHDDIPTPVRFKTTHKIERTFKVLTDNKHHNRIKALTNGKVVREFKLVYEKIIKDMNRNPKLLNLLTHLQTNAQPLFEHSLNVSLYAIAIGRQMFLKESDLYNLGLGAVFHDIGKLKIDSSLLNKKETLTADEMRAYQQHTVHGFEILKAERGLHLLVAHCAYQHHERIDGKGYPRQLKGKDIHLFGQIVGVADLFDSLLRGIEGNEPMLPHEAMEVIVSRTFTHFDKKVVDAFKRAVAIYPIGLTVQLNTGESAVVIDYNPLTPDRPIVRVFKDKLGNDCEHYEIDMFKQLNVMITACDAVLDFNHQRQAIS